MITKLAVRWITRQLRKDEALWYAYQSNIAMTISDNMSRYMPLRTAHGVKKTSPARNGEYPICPRCLTPTVAYAHMTSDGNKTIYCTNGDCNYDVKLETLTTPIKDASPDPLNKDYLPTKHEFCNICANDFLNLWTKQPKGGSDEQDG